MIEEISDDKINRVNFLAVLIQTMNNKEETSSKFTVPDSINMDRMDKKEFEKALAQAFEDEEQEKYQDAEEGLLEVFAPLTSSQTSNS